MSTQPLESDCINKPLLIRPYPVYVCNFDIILVEFLSNLPLNCQDLETNRHQ